MFQVKDFMTKDVITCAPDDKISYIIDEIGRASCRERVSLQV